MSWSFSDIECLNLRGTPCPTNYVRCKLALESLHHDDSLYVDLDKGEPVDMVIPALKKEGNQVKIISEEDNWLRLLVTKGA